MYSVCKSDAFATSQSARYHLKQRPKIANTLEGKDCARIHDLDGKGDFVLNVNIGHAQKGIFSSNSLWASTRPKRIGAIDFWISAGTCQFNVHGNVVTPCEICQPST